MLAAISISKVLGMALATAGVCVFLILCFVRR